MNSGSEITDFQDLHTHLICIRDFTSIMERTSMIRSSQRLTGDSASGRAEVVLIREKQCSWVKEAVAAAAMLSIHNWCMKVIRSIN